MTFARHSITKLVVVSMASAALSLTTHGIAAADATDDAFVVKVSDDALYFSSRNQVIVAGHQVCAAFSSGGTPAQVLDTMRRGWGFTPRQGAIFMADAAQAYCPKYAGQFVTT